MSATVSTARLQRRREALKRPTILAERAKVAARRAAENLDRLGFLQRLCELELLERARRAAERRRRGSRP